MLSVIPFGKLSTSGFKTIMKKITQKVSKTVKLGQTQRRATLK